MDKIKFKNNADEYEPTDSEEDYSEEEKELLQEVRKGRKRDESKQKEVLAFTESEDEGEEDEEDEDAEAEAEDDEDDDDMGLADSDIEGAEVNEDDLPDTKYWGKKTSAYYNTDFVDQDYSSYNEKEEELAKLEEEEAKAIQLRLAKQLKEEDFALDSAFSKLKKNKKGLAEEEDKSLKGTLLKADFSGLSKRERLELFEKDSPEFAGLVGDFEGYLEEIQQLHAPVLRHVHEHNLNMIPALQFAQHYQNIAMTYCSNLAFYLLLKAKRCSIENHPIIQRLTQLKKLLNQLDDKHENIIKPQLEALLERIQDGDEFEILDLKNVPPPPGEEKSTKRSKKQRQLGILSAYGDDEGNVEEEGPAKKKTKMEHDNDLATLAEMSSDDGEDDDNDNEMVEEEEGEEGDAESRRGITYQIAKNKGLMPHRKKEQRNPRVKHRGKYRKALIRRKGAVRTVRKETTRYGGEISGIKATVSKSVKFRT
ncbi:something about silencing protein 10 [Lucilia sericata]|uniref:something about silencing protein 10 n=1 Tax=Lucilia sericata TaxID=13632 RepID=UPI0018A84EB5|nr:something about silencing protein 10 [Lucilia sericata]